MIRLGRVDYINTFPLAWSLGRHLGDSLAEEVVGVPTRLNALLRSGEIDVGNVSSVEYARNHRSYVLLPSLCVGSDGAVESVQLVTDLPLPAVRSISVTGQSASSVVLVRTLFTSAEVLPEGEDADAVLMIGDQALRSAFDDPRPHHDLGALWRERTGLPMVFAVWAARVGTPGLDELDRALAGAVAEAHEHSADVARAAAVRYGYPAGYLARYFEKLRYRFGERERAGLARFFELAHAAGALDEVPSLRFVSDLESVS
jgi:chorismate dehydratase